MSPPPPTRSAPASSNGSWTRRSARSCPRRPNAAASNGPTAATSPSRPSRPPSTAPPRSTASSTCPTPWTSSTPSSRSRPSSRTSAPTTRSTYADQSRSASSPAANSPSTSPTTATPVVEPVETPHRIMRKIVLYVHLSQDALTARLEHRNQLITPGQIQQWCGDADQVIVKPVLDPNAHDPVDSPAVPGPARRDRRRQRCDLRLPLVHPDPPAAATPTTSSPPPAADLPVRATKPPSADDTTGSRPTAPGPTPPSNPAPTSGESPHGYQYLRDPTGTLDLTPEPDR